MILSAAVGFSLGWVGKLLPLPWGLYWDGAICLAGIAASVYMAWDMRRMERERIERMNRIEKEQQLILEYLGYRGWRSAADKQNRLWFQ